MKEAKILKDIEFGTINVHLKAIMEEQGISINKLAFRAEMQRSQLRSYMNGKIQRLDMAILARLCYALECDLHDLLEYVPPEEIEET